MYKLLLYYFLLILNPVYGQIINDTTKIKIEYKLRYNEKINETNVIGLKLIEENPNDVKGFVNFIFNQLCNENELNKKDSTKINMFNSLNKNNSYNDSCYEASVSSILNFSNEILYLPKYNQFNIYTLDFEVLNQRFFEKKIVGWFNSKKIILKNKSNLKEKTRLDNPNVTWASYFKVFLPSLLDTSLYIHDNEIKKVLEFEPAHDIFQKIYSGKLKVYNQNNEIYPVKYFQKSLKPELSGKDSVFNFSENIIDLLNFPILQIEQTILLIRKNLTIESSITRIKIPLKKGNSENTTSFLYLNINSNGVIETW